MNHKLPIAAASIAIALGTIGQLSVRATTLNFDELVIFGDSISDVNNFYNLSGEAEGSFLQPPFYAQGRFSNGPIWVEYLAQDLNFIPETIDNFALGGSTSGSTNIGFPGIPAGLEQQIDTLYSPIARSTCQSQRLIHLVDWEQRLFPALKRSSHSSPTTKSAR
ncbi:MAG: hypothetical protein IGR93_07590 [Hydrococcus sp. C42_A2020_068]|nr:hypothetical protein [Hydrococcus sp. C42_A2020_068]